MEPAPPVWLQERIDAIVREPSPRREAAFAELARLHPEFAADLRAVAEAFGCVYPERAAPTEIGPYRVLERLGAGGMGEVWLAEQSEPIRRRVAIKVIKLGMD